MNCKKALLLLLSAVLIMLTGCSAGTTTAAADAAEKQQRQVFAMDTIMQLTAYGENAEAALDAAEEEIYALDADLDPEDESGSVYAMNAGAGGTVTVSQDCYNIMSTALSFYTATGGALDPGLYPIIKAWGFTTGDYRVPEQDELDQLLAQKDTAAILLDEETCSVTLPAGTEVSLGAVAKGYTAQQVVDIMAQAGVESAVVSLGGNVQTLGQTKPDGSSWQVAVIDPRDSGSYVGMLALGQAAVVTSGGYQRYFEQDGVTYIHILDPATGRPVDNDLLSVTVVAEDGTSADALSTALFVMGLDGALEYYETEGGFELVLITTDSRVIVTPGLADCFTPEENSYTYETYEYSR